MVGVDSQQVQELGVGLIGQAIAPGRIGAPVSRSRLASVWWGEPKRINVELSKSVDWFTLRMYSSLVLASGPLIETSLNGPTLGRIKIRPASE